MLVSFTLVLFVGQAGSQPLELSSVRGLTDKCFTKVGSSLTHKHKSFSSHSLMFASNKSSLPQSGEHEGSSTLVGSDLTHKHQIRLEGLLGTNTKNYPEHSSTMTAQSFVTFSRSHKIFVVNLLTHFCKLGLFPTTRPPLLTLLTRSSLQKHKYIYSKEIARLTPGACSIKLFGRNIVSQGVCHSRQKPL